MSDPRTQYFSREAGKLRSQLRSADPIARAGALHRLRTHFPELANVPDADVGARARKSVAFEVVAREQKAAGWRELLAHLGGTAAAEVAEIPQFEVVDPGYWCATNECESALCHRCFPRRGCRHHDKCQDFTREGEAMSEEEIMAEFGGQVEPSGPVVDTSHIGMSEPIDICWRAVSLEEVERWTREVSAVGATNIRLSGTPWEGRPAEFRFTATIGTALRYWYNADDLAEQYFYGGDEELVALDRLDGQIEYDRKRYIHDLGISGEFAMLMNGDVPVAIYELDAAREEVIGCVDRCYGGARAPEVTAPVWVDQDGRRVTDEAERDMLREHWEMDKDEA
jgi:hypothetical protein